MLPPAILGGGTPSLEWLDVSGNPGLSLGGTDDDGGDDGRDRVSRGDGGGRARTDARWATALPALRWLRLDAGARGAGGAMRGLAGGKRVVTIEAVGE